MNKETAKSRQSLNKEIMAEKKLQSFSENISAASTFSVPTQQQPQTRLEKLRSAIDKAFYFSPNEIILNENVRSSIDVFGTEFLALKASIAANGILQPAVVELREDGSENYQLIAVNGHRRILAAQELGIEKIMCIVKKYSKNDTRLLHGLTENLLRSDLEPLDIAEGYAKLMVLSWKAEHVAEYFGKDLNYVYCIVKLANFSYQAKEIIRENKEKFSMRVLINEFVRKKWANESDLINALKRKIGNNGETYKAESSLKKEKNKKSLEVFYQLNSGISEESKGYVEKALRHFKIL